MTGMFKGILDLSFIILPQRRKIDFLDIYVCVAIQYVGLDSQKNV